MKMIIVLAALVAIACAAPPKSTSQHEVEIVKYFNDNIGLNGYKFGFETSDGSSRHETAEVKNVGTEDEAIVVRGSFTYIDPSNGHQYTVNYVADENGYRPEGDHIPKA